MKKLLLPLFLLSLSLFLLAKPVFADEISSFDTKITAHKDGTMDILETIKYVFDSQHHGIYRDIPLFTKVGNLYRISDIKFTDIKRDGASEEYSTSKTGQALEVKIGNPDRTITGEHTYTIEYLVTNGIGSNFADHDEIYWNTTGNNWDVPIASATAKVLTDFTVTSTSSLCFTGVVGSKDQNCTMENNFFVSTQPVYIGEGMSIVAVYPVGTFPKSILSSSPPQTFSEKAWQLFLRYIRMIYFVLNIIFSGVLLYWYEKHKNKKRFGAPSVNFEIPKDENGRRLAPALAGTIDSAKLSRDDITATIFDLAIRKYIKLEQSKTVKKLLPDKTDQTITKLKDTDKSLESFETILMDRLFEDGESVKVSDLKLDFYKTFQDMQGEVFKSLIEKGYYTKNPMGQRVFLSVIGTFFLFTLNIPLAFTFFFLSRRLNGRTALGDEIDFRIDGLKLFLKAMDRNYKWQAQRFYTVEQMIPYAMALGYIDRFMEALKILKPDYNPSWYGGGNFYMNYALFSAAATSSFTTSAPSSSSGAGGGGFSGGGGGGGGGGGW